uniref:CCHC-type domain-containing protein n=1 Tax=Ditylenchus dipsaci TaxID=166011 RepID=A0A915D3C3_9BILA
MSNANFTPLGPNRKWPRDNSDPSASNTSGGPSRPTHGGFVDASGEVLVKPPVTGACRKCGFTGHLPYQCRNFIQLPSKSSNHTSQIDVSSTSSEGEYETPLKSAKKEKKAMKKEAKKLKKIRKQVKKKVKEERRKRRRSPSSSSSSDSDERHKHKKKSKSTAKRNTSDVPLPLTVLIRTKFSDLGKNCFQLFNCTTLLILLVKQ